MPIFYIFFSFSLFLLPFPHSSWFLPYQFLFACSHANVLLTISLSIRFTSTTSHMHFPSLESLASNSALKLPHAAPQKPLSAVIGSLSGEEVCFPQEELAMFLQFVPKKTQPKSYRICTANAWPMGFHFQSHCSCAQSRLCSQLCIRGSPPFWGRKMKVIANWSCWMTKILLNPTTCTWCITIFGKMSSSFLTNLVPVFFLFLFFCCLFGWLVSWLFLFFMMFEKIWVTVYI